MYLNFPDLGRKHQVGQRFDQLVVQLGRLDDRVLRSK